MSRIIRRHSAFAILVVAIVIGKQTPALAQSVGLPAPRLLTTTPMGGRIDSSVDVVVQGDNIEHPETLLFSDPRITAVQKLDADGLPVDRTFVVTIADDCPLGVHDARVMARLGISSARSFTVGDLPELSQTKPCKTVAEAFPIQIDSVCNAVVSDRAVNHYSFTATAGQHIFVDCAASGIDSKLKPVIIVADAEGNDLVAERRGGAIDFNIPTDGTYIVKLHDLTFKGGSYYFARLAIRSVVDGVTPSCLPAVAAVKSFSWPPVGISPSASIVEDESATSQVITLPCDLAGRFYPAADRDTFEFDAAAGQTWWVEVASDRLGRPTDPFVVVQKVGAEDSSELTDIVELNDIASPVKRSSNGYSYDGPPYNAGSSDVLGKVEVKEDGRYRLTITDLFGGTRNDPRNSYRLVIREATPDFAIVGWALHMGLRNGDRNALSKPVSLRGGATIPFEVVAVRRDGFAGEIDLRIENLPEGVTATGLKIGAGMSRGTILFHAAYDAPRGLSFARVYGTAEIADEQVVRECRMASMKWPVTNARTEIPAPRLMANFPISVGGAEESGLSIEPAESKIWEVKAEGSLTLPLAITRRGEFSGKTMALQTFGAGFEKAKKFDVTFTNDTAEAVIDLAKLKTPPGDYRIAFYGGAVLKYRDNLDAVESAKLALSLAERKVDEINTKLSTVIADEKGQPETLADQKKSAEKEVAAIKRQLANAEKKAKPKDIVDIYVSSPIDIKVLPPADTK